MLMSLERHSDDASAEYFAVDFQFCQTFCFHICCVQYAWEGNNIFGLNVEELFAVQLQFLFWLLELSLDLRNLFVPLLFWHWLVSKREDQLWGLKVLTFPSFRRYFMAKVQISIMSRKLLVSPWWSQCPIFSKRKWQSCCQKSGSLAFKENSP